jgi:HEAT repeat protein
MEEVLAAAFSNATERIIFTKALSDFASWDAAARADAARAMASISHELSVRVLVAQMEHEPSPQVRQECIKALTTLGGEQGLPVIEYALTDESASVRLAAVQGLYHLVGAESVPVLIRMFSDENERVRRRAASCIGWLGQKKLAAELLPLLTDSNVSVRRAAVEAMGNLRSRQVVSALIEHLNDPEKSVRKAVLGALETITGKRMKELFPQDEMSLQRLIARWREWWKEELLKR